MGVILAGNGERSRSHVTPSSGTYSWPVIRGWVRCQNRQMTPEEKEEIGNLNKQIMKLKTGTVGPGGAKDAVDVPDKDKFISSSQFKSVDDAAFEIAKNINAGFVEFAKNPGLYSFATRTAMRALSWLIPFFGLAFWQG